MCASWICLCEKPQCQNKSNYTSWSFQVAFYHVHTRICLCEIPNATTSLTTPVYTIISGRLLCMVCASRIGLCENPMPEQVWLHQFIISGRLLWRLSHEYVCVKTTQCHNKSDYTSWSFQVAFYRVHTRIGLCEKTNARASLTTPVYHQVAFYRVHSWICLCEKPLPEQV